VNIGNRTSVKSGDVRHIEHRIAMWHRYRFGGRRHLAAQRDNSACWLTLGSAITVKPRHTACVRGVRLISVRDIQRYLRSRRQRASDDGVSEEGYMRGTRADNAVKLGRHSASLSTLSSHRPCPYTCGSSPVNAIRGS